MKADSFQGTDVTRLKGEVVYILEHLLREVQRRALVARGIRISSIFDDILPHTRSVVYFGYNTLSPTIRG